MKEIHEYFLKGEILTGMFIGVLKSVFQELTLLHVKHGNLHLQA